VVGEYWRSGACFIYFGLGSQALFAAAFVLSLGRSDIFPVFSFLFFQKGYHQYQEKPDAWSFAFRGQGEMCLLKWTACNIIMLPFLSFSAKKKSKLSESKVL
jgi:hypothetical protein